MKKSILAFLFCAFSLSVAMSQNLTFQGKAVSSIFVRPGMCYFNRDKIFYNYVMLHAIYRSISGESRLALISWSISSPDNNNKTKDYIYLC